MYEQARTEYLNKIRAIEKIDREDGRIVRKKADSSGASISSPSQSPSVGPTSYVIPPIQKWPDKMELPAMTRLDYNNASIAYAQSNILNPDVFTILNSAKFDQAAPRCTGDGYVRKDLAFYLEELHSIVAPKLGLSKLYITSSFRTLEYHNVKVYGLSASTPTSSPHLGGIAVDISANDEARYTIADAAYYMGFGGIAVGDGFVHLDISKKEYWPYDPIPTYYSPDKRYG